MREEHIKKGHIRKVKNSEKPSLRKILPELKELLTNWTFLFNSLGVGIIFIYAGALLSFYPKILQLKFGLRPDETGYYLGVLLSPSMAGK